MALRWLQRELSGCRFEDIQVTVQDEELLSGVIHDISTQMIYQICNVDGLSVLVLGWQR